MWRKNFMFLQFTRKKDYFIAEAGIGQEGGRRTEGGHAERITQKLLKNRKLR